MECLDEDIQFGNLMYFAYYHYVDSMNLEKIRWEITRFPETTMFAKVHVLKEILFFNIVFMIGNLPGVFQLKCLLFLTSSNAQSRNVTEMIG